MNAKMTYLPKRFTAVRKTLEVKAGVEGTSKENFWSILAQVRLGSIVSEIVSADLVNVESASGQSETCRKIRLIAKCQDNISYNNLP